MNSVYSKLSFLLPLIACTYINQISAQEVLNEPFQLNWEKQQIKLNSSEFQTKDVYFFEKGCREDDLLEIPYLKYLFEVQGPGDLKIYLTELETELQHQRPRKKRMIPFCEIFSPHKLPQGGGLIRTAEKGTEYSCITL